MTADHLVRPIMVPRDVNVLPWHSGYAEAINAGKSLRNEDQAAFHRGVLRACDLPAEVESEVAGTAVDIPYVYFGTFDGHAGSGCAVAAANELHVVLHRCNELRDLPLGTDGGSRNLVNAVIYTYQKCKAFSRHFVPF